MFELLETSSNPAAQRLRLLRWLIFQVLIGSADAHAKNLAFCRDRRIEHRARLRSRECPRVGSRSSGEYVWRLLCVDRNDWDNE